MSWHWTSAMYLYTICYTSIKWKKTLLVFVTLYHWLGKCAVSTVGKVNPYDISYAGHRLLRMRLCLLLPWRCYSNVVQMLSHFLLLSYHYNLKIIKCALYFMTVICCNTNTNQRIPFRRKISQVCKVIGPYSHSCDVNLSWRCTKKPLKQHDDLL